MDILLLILGLVILTIGADLLVRGASGLAVACGIPPLVVGLTVVAFGTGSPELVVCLQSSLSGEPDVALGNVLGSNILNVLLILGLSAVVIPLRVSLRLIWYDVPLMVGLSVALYLMAWDGAVSRIDGALLLTFLIVYTTRAVLAGLKERKQAEHPPGLEPPAPGKSPSIPLMIMFFVVGLAMLVGGSSLFVNAAVSIARSFGVSELVVGLTIVALGTSLPEVATSVAAALRGERDIAVGNVVGSNLFNIAGVLGVTSLATSGGIPVSDAAFQLDLPVMVAASAACLPIFFTGHLIARWEGALFLTYYVLYTAHLMTAALVPAVNRTLATIVWICVVPLTVITLGVGVVRGMRSGAESEGD